MQVKSKFEAGMVWGKSQMERGSSNAVEPCAKPGCDPFPKCCVTGDTYMVGQIQGWSVAAEDEQLWKALHTTLISHWVLIFVISWSAYLVVILIVDFVILATYFYSAKLLSLDSMQPSGGYTWHEHSMWTSYTIPVITLKLKVQWS